MKGGFAQLFLDAVDAFSQRLTPQQRGLLFTLCGRIGRADTIPRHGRHRNGEPLGVSDIARLMGWTREYTSRQLRAIAERTTALRILGEGPARHVELSASFVHRYARRGGGDDGA